MLSELREMFRMKYDVIIVGAGPAGIFTAIEMIQKKSQKKILIIERQPYREAEMPRVRHKGMC